MAQSTKYQLCKHEDLSADPQNIHLKKGGKRVSMIVCTCNPSAGKVQTGRQIPGTDMSV